MRILCVNDDGVAADGLRLLEGIAAQFSDDVWTVAPETDQSGIARALTLTHPVRMREVGEKCFAVAGTPSDCVEIGMRHILKDKAPDLVLSGVNNGQNLAEDVTVSGTVAAAFQALSFSVPAIALSLARFSRHHCNWEAPRVFAPDIIRRLLAGGWAPSTVVNINFPDLAPEDIRSVLVTRQGNRDRSYLKMERRSDLRERDYYWYGFDGHLSDPLEGTDLHAVYNGHISITPLHLRLTNDAALPALMEKFKNLPQEEQVS